MHRSQHTSPQLDRPDRQDQIEPDTDQAGLDQEVSNLTTGSGRIRPSQTKPGQASDRPYRMTGRIQDQAIPDQAVTRQAAYRTRSGHRPLNRPLHSTRPAGRPPQIFLPNLTAHYSAMRVVQAPSLALTLFDVPACWQADCSAKSVNQSQALLKPDDCARLLGGRLDTEHSHTQ